MKEFRLWVSGKPIPKGRPRVTISRGCPIAYTPKTTREWENRIKLAYREQVGAAAFGEGEDIFLRCEFFSPDRRADGDNLYKSVADALQGVGYPNDRRIVRGEFSIVRERGREAGVQICAQAVTDSN